MKKKIIMYIGIIFLILIIILIGYLVYINHHNNNTQIIEYTPEAEITDEQLRQTIVTLYFMNKETSNLMAEARQIDAKDLIENPYSTIINLLIQGPKNERLIKLIPEETILNNTKVEGDCLYIDFSEEFIENQNLGKEQEELIIKSIVNTVTELVEINSVIFTINGEENLEFPDGEVSFNKKYIREF